MRIADTDAKVRFIAKVEDRRMRFHLFLDAAGIDWTADWDRLVAGDWTLGDTIAHLAAWERRFAATIRFHLDGTPKPDEYRGGWEGFNDRMHAKWSSFDRAAIEAEYADAHNDLIAALESVPDEGPPAKTDYWKGWHTSLITSHYREHVTAISEHLGLPKPPAWRGLVNA